jgi:hypothetical protein
MAIDAIQTVEIIETMENFIARIRPPESIRSKLDIGYRIANQSIVLFEIRPFWDDNTQYHNYDFAKTTYSKKSGVWKIYWLRASLKWNLYAPCPTVKTLSEFLEVVDADQYGCFKG